MPRKFISKYETPPESHLTTQQVFDTVCEHLITQGAKSKVKAGKPAFKNENGLKCAVGCLIEDYDVKMESYGSSLNRLFEGYDSLSHLVIHLPLLMSLQRAHDYSSPETFVEDVKEKLLLVADELSLSIPTCIKKDKHG